MAIVQIEMPAIIRNKLEKLEALTIGPSNHTANELTPNDTARRMPATRERILSSTYLTIIASVKGIAPKMHTMTPSKATNTHQPLTVAANSNQGICASTMPKYKRLSEPLSIRWQIGSTPCRERGWQN